jgi:DNA-binding NarL/FixJ family response regulator
VDKLTWAEEAVMEHLAHGWHPKEIANQRSVTITAISKISRRAREKLGARTTYEAVALYVKGSLR